MIVKMQNLVKFLRQTRHGDTVKIHYTGHLQDGTVFDTTKNRSPLSFTVGQAQVIPGIDEAVVGMSPGDIKRAELPPHKAYGSHYEEFILEMELSEYPDALGEPTRGQSLELGGSEGQMVQLTVTEVTESKVTLDANHPLAGKTLTFDIELLEIE